MSISNNKFKSTTIYGKFVVADTPDGTITADTHLSRDLLVDGKINNIPNATINYIANLTSDAQTQINNKANATDLTSLLSKTTDLTYDSSTLTTTYGNNVIVNGTMNGLTYDRCIYLDYLPTVVNNHSTKLTDITYSTASVKTTIGQNLVVNGLI